jgi:hypothetical protein
VLYSWNELLTARSHDVDDSWLDGIPETYVYQLQRHLQQSQYC